MTTVSEAKVESEVYFQTHFPGEDIEEYGGHNDEVDAYRHAYTSAVLAYELGAGLAGALGWAWEVRGTLFGQPYNEFVMDSINNRQGLDTAASLSSGLPNYKELIAADLAQKLQNGELKILEPHFASSTSDDYTEAQQQADRAQADFYRDLLDDYQSFWDVDESGRSERRSGAAGADNDGETIPSARVDSANASVSDASLTSSPLVLDLDGDGIELTSLNSADCVYWDIDNDGFAEASAWVASDDGLLAIDINEDGIINDHTELFGDKTGFADGFSALAFYDENNDGVIDSSDDVWSDLIVWRDANGNGYSEASELHTLADFDILSINLNASVVSQTIAGNPVTLSSSYTYDTGSGTATRTIVDAWFRYSDVNTAYDEPITLDPAVLFLPTLRGYGTLPDLHIAMSLDNEGTGNLLELVDDFAALELDDLFDDANDPYSAVRDILFRWAGVDGVDPDSRGWHIDARELAFLEKLTGQPFLQYGTSPDPGFFAALELKEAFVTAMDNFYAQLTAQSAGGELFEGDWHYDVATDSFVGITGLDDDVIDNLATAATGSGDPALFWVNVVRMVEYTVGTANLSGGDYDALNDAIELTLSGDDLEDVLDLLHEEVAFVTTNGTSGVDNLVGTSAHDIMYGGADNDTLTGNAGNDTLHGEAGADHLYGGSGSDLLIGGTGADVYYFDQAGGDDTINDGGATSSENDKIVFGAGITLGDLTFTRISNFGLKIDIDDATSVDDFIIIEDQFDTYYTASAGIETLEFADTSTFDLSTVNYTLTGTSANETLWGVTGGGSTTDTIYGEGGNDSIYGGAGNDTLYGGDGMDYLYGEAGNDTLHGNDDNDKIYGGADNDTAYGGAGNDYISVHAGNDTVYTGAGNDTVLTGAGDDNVYYDGFNLTLSDYDGNGGSSYGGNDILFMPSDVIALDLAFSRTGDDLIIDVEGRGTITIGYHFTGNDYKWETIQFADMSTLDLSTIVLTVTGTSGNDTLNGASGNDTIYGLGGNDTLTGNGADDKLYGGDDNDTLYGNDGNDRLYGGTGTNTINGHAGNDEIYIQGGTDDIRTGLGNDTLFYESGTVTVQESYSSGTSGGTETIEMAEDIDPADVTLSRSSASANNLLITIAGKGTITVNYQFYGTADAFEYIHFASDDSTITLASTSITTTGTSGNDSVSGVQYGGGPNDILYGLDGNDSLYGYAGNDVLYGGNGTDNLYGYDGDDQLYGEDGSDNLYAYGTGNDLYDGGAGNDYMEDTYGGNDVYVYSGGLDIVYDNTGTDILRLTGSTTVNDLSFSDLGNHHKITITASVDEIQLYWVDYSSVYLIETIEFADGFSTSLNTWKTWNNGTGSGETLNGTASADTIIGFAGNDTLNGNDGNDAMHGGADDDTLNGGNGADLLHGGAGADTLNGNDGLDTLYGGDGADIFLFDTDAFNNVDSVKDFNAGQNDALDIANILVGYDPMTDDIAEWVSFTNSSGNSQMFVDRDGTGGTYSAAQIALLHGIVDLDAEDLLTNGNLIAA